MRHCQLGGRGEERRMTSYLVLLRLRAVLETGKIVRLARKCVPTGSMILVRRLVIALGVFRVWKLVPTRVTSCMRN